MHNCVNYCVHITLQTECPEFFPTCLFYWDDITFILMPRCFSYLYWVSYLDRTLVTCNGLWYYLYDTMPQCSHIWHFTHKLWLWGSREFATHFCMYERNECCYQLCIGVIPGQDLMMSSNGNIFRVTGPLWGEFTGHRWIPLTKASDAELWCFPWSAPEQTVDQTIETPVIWDAITLIMMSL